MITPDKERVLREAREELPKAKELCCGIEFDLTAVLAVTAALQLALRHPGYRGAAASVVRDLVSTLIAGVEAAELPATARLLRLGDNPDYDDEAEP